MSNIHYVSCKDTWIKCPFEVFSFLCVHYVCLFRQLWTFHISIFWTKWNQNWHKCYFGGPQYFIWLLGLFIPSDWLEIKISTVSNKIYDWMLHLRIVPYMTLQRYVWIKVIFSSILIPFVLWGVHVLFMLFVFLKVFWHPTQFPYQMMFV